MKLDHLIKTLKNWEHIPTEVVSWLKKHVKNLELKPQQNFSFENGELSLDKESRLVLTGISDNDVPSWKFGKVGEIEFDHSCSFTKFDFLPYHIDYNLYFDFKMSLKGIHKRVKSCNIFYLSKDTTSGILDILKIEDIRGGIVVSGGASNLDPDFKKAFLMVKFGFEDEEDILDVQDKLFNAGLERFA
jgi:hypothetical protein